MAPRGGGALRLILNSYATSVREGEPEPTFSPPPIVVVEFKLDSDREGRPEVELGEFQRLLNRIDRFRNGMIEWVEVRAWIPRRLFFQTVGTEVLQ